MKDQEKIFIEAHNIYSDQIFRFVLFRLNDRERSKELTQEVFMKTWVYISEHGELKNIRAFLYKVASNMVVDEYRKKGRASITSLDSLMEYGYDVGVDEKETNLDRLEGSQILNLARNLPQSYSEVIFMRYVEELSISEISNIVGQSSNIISVRLNRGMKKLKDLFDKKIKK